MLGARGAAPWVAQQETGVSTVGEQRLAAHLSAGVRGDPRIVHRVCFLPTIAVVSEYLNCYICQLEEEGNEQRSESRVQGGPRK